MFVKKIKRKCGVRGCKNTNNVYALSRTREMGNSVIMCQDCMKDAFASTENYVEPVKVTTERKPLFYHPELSVTLSSVADTEPKPQEVIKSGTEENHITSVAEDTVTFTIPEEEQEPVTAPKPKTTTNTTKRKPKQK